MSNFVLNGWGKLPIPARRAIHRCLPPILIDAAKAIVRGGLSTPPTANRDGNAENSHKTAPQRPTVPPNTVNTPTTVAEPPVVPDWFSPEWYESTNAEAERTYDHFLATGSQRGTTPHPLFILPEMFNGLPDQHKWRVSGSPVLCRAPASLYLSHFRKKKELHNLYHTLDEYLRRSTTRPNLIGERLWENDVRIASYMDSQLRRLALKYKDRPQAELISVIMPTFNRSREIADAILSVLAQSYQNWELIIVDDASEELGTADVVASFAEERIRYIRLDERVGNGQVRNIGIKNSTGSVIAYLDDDDQWDPDNLLVLYWQMRDAKARSAYGAQAVWTGYDPRTWLGEKFKAIRFAPFNRSLLENTNYISMISLIHERTVLDEIGNLDASLSRFLDWDLFLRITEVAPPVAVPAILSHYYQGRAAVSISEPSDKAVPLKEIRNRAEARADVRVAYRTKDGVEHTAYSTGRNSRAHRKEKLASIPHPKVRIIIPNFEAVDELTACIESIRDHTTTPHDVIIADNNSSPASWERIQRLVSRYENVKVVQEKQPGFSHAVNRGLVEPRDPNDLVMILNNDTIVMPDWLDEMIYVLHKHPNAVVAVPRQVLPAGNKIIKPHVPSAMDTYECDINLSSHHDNVRDPYFDVQDGLIELSYAPLFCALIRPDALETIGRLDSRNGAHFRSDWVFFDEIRRLTGGKIIYTSNSKVYHMQGVSTHLIRS